jgi:hypothetical protein
MTRAPRTGEAAAIAAAIERFRAETGPVAAEEREVVSPWQRAALAEGIGAKGTVLQDSEGGLKWLS